MVVLFYAWHLNHKDGDTTGVSMAYPKILRRECYVQRMQFSCWTGKQLPDIAVHLVTALYMASIYRRQACRGHYIMPTLATTCTRNTFKTKDSTENGHNVIFKLFWLISFFILTSSKQRAQEVLPRTHGSCLNFKIPKPKTQITTPSRHRPFC